MESEVRVKSHNLRLTITIGFFLTIIVLFGMLMYTVEFRLLFLSIAGVVAGCGLVLIWRGIGSTRHTGRIKNLEYAIMQQRLRQETYTADRLELQSAFVSFSRTERVIFPKSDAYHIIDALPDLKTTSALPAPLLPAPLRKLLDIAASFIHVQLIGGTGSGKTTAMNHLIDIQPPGSRIYVLDPHEKFDDWSARAEIIGANLDYAVIERSLANIYNEMRRRYTGDERNFPRIVVVMDEWPAIVSDDDCPGAAGYMRKLAREGRKANIRLILGAQGDSVKDLGIEGHGSVRENFVTIRLDPLMTRRNQATLEYADKTRETIELPGPYYTNRKFFDLTPDTLTPDTSPLDTAFIRDVRAGMSQNDLIKKHFGGMRRTDAIAAVKQKKADLGLTDD